MSVMTTLPWGRPLTADDLDSMPDDGHRYEVVDGTLLVSPGPVPMHQLVVSRLLRTLSASAPAGVEVLSAPLDVRLADDTQVQPDILVVRRSDLGPHRVEVPPMLVVEVLSPSTRLVDLNLKRARYERAGIASYWVVDPAMPRLIAWEFHDGGYAEAADVTGDEEWTAATPYAVTVTPARLVD